MTIQNKPITIIANDDYPSPVFILDLGYTPDVSDMRLQIRDVESGNTLLYDAEEIVWSVTASKCSFIIPFSQNKKWSFQNAWFEIAVDKSDEVPPRRNIIAQGKAEIKKDTIGQPYTLRLETVTSTPSGGASMTNAEVKAAYEANANTNAFTDAEKTKVAGLESSHYKGTYASSGALDTAHPTAIAGDYADVDAGVGQDVQRYIWDADDSAWVVQQGAAGNMSGAQIKVAYESEVDTNAYTDTDKTKLSNVEANATADQTGAQIKAAYESQVDTNAFTDTEKTKVAGLEGSHYKGTYASSGALDTAHPTAIAGDYADVDAGVGQDVQRYIWDANDNQWVAQQGPAGSMTGAQIKTAYEAEADTNAFTNAEKTQLAGVEDNATVDQTAAEIATAYHSVSNEFTGPEKTKLAGLSDSHYKGSHLSLAALNTAHPSAVAGDYADVDAGVGQDAVRHIWDADDSAWIPSGSAAVGTGDFKADGTVAMTGPLITDDGNLQSTAADVAGAIGFDFDTSVNLTEANTKILRAKNNGVARFTVGADGQIFAYALPSAKPVSIGSIWSGTGFLTIGDEPKAAVADVVAGTSDDLFVTAKSMSDYAQTLSAVDTDPYDKTAWLGSLDAAAKAPLRNHFESGNVRSTSVIKTVNRWVGEIDNRWVTNADNTYGHNAQSADEYGGTAADPVAVPLIMGSAVRAGVLLRDIHIIGHGLSAPNLTDFDISIRLYTPTADSKWESGISVLADYNEDEIYRDLFMAPTGGGAVFTGTLNNQMHWRTISLNHVVMARSMYVVWAQFQGTLTIIERASLEMTTEVVW